GAAAWCGAAHRPLPPARRLPRGSLSPGRLAPVERGGASRRDDAHLLGLRRLRREWVACEALAPDRVPPRRQGIVRRFQRLRDPAPAVLQPGPSDGSLAVRAP